jgi:hypothetical protein
MQGKRGAIVSKEKSRFTLGRLGHGETGWSEESGAEVGTAPSDHGIGTRERR